MNSLECHRAQRLKISKPMTDVTKADIIEAIRAGKVSTKTYPVPSSP